MNVNFLYIREKAGIEKKVIARLLNVSVYVYTRYELSRLRVPNEICGMFSKMFNISLADVHGDINNLSDTTISVLNYLNALNENEKELYLILNLVGKPMEHVSYREIEKIKQEFEEFYKNNEVSSQ